MKNKLNPFQLWMVRQNIGYVRTEGLETVTARLRANGYPNIADAVEEQLLAEGEMSEEGKVSS